MLNAEAIVLAGGFGTRLQKVVQEVPKPMASINGKPFLEYLLNYLKNQGVSSVILSVGYKHKVISDHFGSVFNGIKLKYCIEDTPLGTGGGIRKALLSATSSDVFVVNGDTLFDIDLKELFQFYKKNNSELSIALKLIDHVSRYGTVEIDCQSKIVGFYEKNEKGGKGFINGGIYLMSKTFFSYFQLPDKFSFEKDCMEKYITTNKFHALVSDDYFIDIGIPEDYERAQIEFKMFDK